MTVICRFHLMNTEQRQVAADPQTKPANLDCESTIRRMSSTLTAATQVLCRAKADNSFCHPTEGKKPS